jgi:hypothetical protein
MFSKLALASVVVGLWTSLAVADPLAGAAAGAESDRLPDPAADARLATRPAAEVNVLWPVIGISELKVLVPVTDPGPWHGEVIVGSYLDYAQVVRSGRAFIIAAQPGYRQFLGGGFHVELTATMGIRHEANHPGDGATLNDIYVRAWPTVGYQYDFTPRFYANARALAGILVYRETHQSEEKKLAPAGDVNVGVRF